MFRGFAQQDAQEFLRFLLDKLHTELKDSKDQSIVSQTFRGTIRSMVRCHVCNATSAVDEAFYDLCVELPDRQGMTRLAAKLGQPPDPFSVVDTVSHWLSTTWLGGLLPDLSHCPSVATCLAAFCESEELSGDNMYFCESCNSKREATKTIALNDLPDILCITIKRFKYDTYFPTKLSKHVSFPVDSPLDLRPFLCAELSGMSATYELVALVNHQGSIGHGHYTTLTRNAINDR